MISVRPMREVKRRINICLYPSIISAMDECAARLGVSRSELLEYCFRYWLASANGGGDDE